MKIKMTNSDDSFIVEKSDGSLIDLLYKPTKLSDLDNDGYSLDIDYSKQYFTIVSLEDNNTIGWKASNSNLTRTISISTDNGSTWIEKTSTDEGVTLATLNTGDKLLIKGSNITYGNAIRSPKGTLLNMYNYLTSTEYFNVEGNIMSLIYGDNFIGQLTLTEYYTFRNLFYQCNSLISSENLILPSTTLSQYCYKSMFEGCTSLTTVPAKLPATTLANYCYENMFNDCISLVTAPELPATILTEHCYENMFYGCTSLTTAPALLAMTLKVKCYANMFYGCTSLTAAPKLPATTLANGCYSNMFENCTSLNYINCQATEIWMTDCVNNWVENIGISGIFIKANNMSLWTTGVNGIPTGWTVITEDEYESVHKYELDQLSSRIDKIRKVSVSSNLTNQTTLISSGESETVIYVNSGTTTDYTIIVSSTYKTPDGNAIEITCPRNGYCEVSYINENGTIYVRGL